jgi:hypothetical protein
MYVLKISSVFVTAWAPGDLSQGVKGPGCKANHSPQTSAKVKNAWNYTSAPPYIFIAWYLVKHKISLHGVVLS